MILRRGAAVDLRRGSPSAVIPMMIVGAWLVIAAAQATGSATALHHHALIGGGSPLVLAIPPFLLGWLVMTVAMMLPASLPAIRLAEAAAAGPVRPSLARAALLGGFLSVWSLFGLLAFVGDTVVHGLVDATPWLAARPWLIEAGILALAGAYQFVPLKRRSLEACRHPGGSAGTGSRLDLDVLRVGLRHGLDCLGSSWALMLLMFGEGFASLWWMVALTALMAYEAMGRHAGRAASGAGIVLILVALNVLSGGSSGTP